MGLLLRILSVAALLISILSVILAVGVYLEFQASDTESDADVAIALVLPILVLSVVTGAMAVGAHIVGKRVRNKAAD